MHGGFQVVAVLSVYLILQMDPQGDLRYPSGHDGEGGRNKDHNYIEPDIVNL